MMLLEYEFPLVQLLKNLILVFACWPSKYNGKWFFLTIFYNKNVDILTPCHTADLIVPRYRQAVTRSF